MSRETSCNDVIYGLAGAVVVGVDGSDSSQRALAWAWEQARATGSEVVAITTWDYPTSFGVIGRWPSEVHFDEDARQVLDESVEKAIGPDQSSSVTKLVFRGRPALVLEDASRDAALLVVGSRGHGEVAGVMLGSVSQFLAAHAHCPLVIVRH
jgi:nucleotide-binding universal stress UspA family protein